MGEIHGNLGSSLPSPAKSIGTNIDLVTRICANLSCHKSSLLDSLNFTESQESQKGLVVPSGFAEASLTKCIGLYKTRQGLGGVRILIP